MIVKCSLCGGDNEVQPGQSMLCCSFCGSALALDAASGPDHLILPHDRNDAHAGEVLRSMLLSKGLPGQRDASVEFAYVPFNVIEDGKGRHAIVPANRSIATALPYAPAGDYRFFEAPLAGGEKILDIERVEERTVRVLHLPVYSVRYRSAGREWEALVIGSAWQVVADEFPPRRTDALDAANVIAAAALFAVFLFVAKVMPSALGRLLLLSAAAGAGVAGFALRERLVKKA